MNVSRNVFAPMADYRCVLTLKEIIDYLCGAKDVIAFDFECSPLEQYRSEPKAALDAHKATITGISFSVTADTGIYVPLTHRVGRNAEEQEKIWELLTKTVFQSKHVTVVMSCFVMGASAASLQADEPSNDANLVATPAKCIDGGSHTWGTPTLQGIFCTKCGCQRTMIAG